MASTAVLYDLIARDNASRTFDRVGRAADGMGSKMAKVAKVAVGVGVALVGLGAGAAEAADKAAEFQSSMTKIQTQAGASAKDVAALTQQVLKLAPSTQQGPQALSEALYHLKSVGMDNVSAMKALKTASDLAAVGGADLEDTTNALAGAWRTGIKGATDFGQAAATVNAIIGAGNMTMTDFTDALSSGILPTAKTFGLTLKQVGAALALFTDEGVPANSAATRLRMSISLLGAPSAAAEKQLKKIGLTGLDLANAMRGPQGIIGAITLLKQHLDASGLSAAQQSQILSRAFGGGKSSSAILSMVNNLDVLKQKQDQVNASTGKYGDAVATQRKTAEAQWKILTSNLETLTIRLGLKLLPPVTGFVQYLNQTAIPAAGRFTSTLTSLVPVGRIKSGFKTVTGVIADFFDGLSGKQKKLPSPVSFASPTAPKPTGVLAPKSSASESKQYGEVIRKAVSGGIADVDWSKTGSALGKALGTAFQWLVKHASSLTKQLIKALSGIDWVDVGKAVGGNAFGFAIGFISSLGNDLFSPDFWKKHWWDVVITALSFFGVGKIAGPLERFISHIPILKVFAPLVRGIGKVTKPVGDAVGKVTKFFGSSLWKGIARVFPEAARVLERESGLVTTRLGVWGLDLLNYGKRAIVGLGNGIKTGTGWVVSKIGELIGYILKPFAATGKWLVSKGADIVRGLTGGITTGAKAIGSFAKSHVIDPLVSAFKVSGSWLWSKGSAAVSGLRDGIVSGAKAIGGFAKTHIIDPVVGAFKTSGSWLISRGRSAVTGLKNGIVDVAKTIGGWTKSHVIDPVVSRFSGSGSWLVSKGKSIISGLKNGIVGSVKTIGSWVKSHVVDPVVNAVKKFFGIHSPSTVFAEIGGHLVAGLMKGLASTSGTAIAKRVFGDLPHALGHLVKKGIVKVSQLPQKALKALGKLGGEFSGLLGVSGGSSGAQALGQAMAASNYHWTGAQWNALKALWTGESGWNYKAKNAASGAYGIPQALPASKMASAGPDWKTNPGTQILWGLRYIKSRYGTPANAYSKWLNRSPHWYDEGGVARGKGYLPKNTPSPERVLSPRQTAAFERLVDVLDRGGQAGARPVVVHVHFDDPTLRDLIRVEVDDGLDDLSTALGAGRSV